MLRNKEGMNKKQFKHLYFNNIQIKNPSCLVFYFHDSSKVSATNCAKVALALGKIEK